MSSIGNDLSHRLEHIIETNKASLYTLSIYFSDKNLEIQEFNSVADKIIEKNSNILYLQHKNKDTITDMVYPFAGNEKTLGGSLYNRSEVVDAVNLAIKERMVTVNDPYILRNMNEEINGVVIRYPIFKGDEFQGFFVSVINMDKILEQYFSQNIYGTYNFNIMDSNNNKFFSSDKNHNGLIFTNTNVKIENISWKIIVYNKNMENNIYIMAICIFIFLNIFGSIIVASRTKSIKKSELIVSLSEVKKRLSEKNEQYEILIDGANDIIWEYNTENKKLLLSDKWSKITGYDINNTDNIDEFLSLFLDSQDISGLKKAFKSYDEKITSYLNYDFKIITSTNIVKWFYVRGKGVRNSEGKITKLLGGITDITERKKYEEQIEYIAYYDALTNLANRNLFMIKANEYLEKLDFNYDIAAIIFIDLDDFKKVNDTLGHNYGDLLLRNFAQILKSSFKKEDIIARFGGDEFIIFIPNLTDELKILDRCNKVSNYLNYPIEINDKSVNITASMGVVLIPKDGTDINILIKNADTAMYKAKELGKNKIFFFNKTIEKEVYRKAEVEKALRIALKNNEFELYYQPQYDTKTLELRGYEALLRWNSKELGAVRPDEFIKVAEKNGLIDSIGKWVLINACLQNAKWIDKGIVHVICVNVSPLQFKGDNFINSVIEALSISGLSPEYLELEITENILLDSYEKSIEILNILRHMGIKIALDDFGTGYSSIKYLKMLPCNNLKIDKSLIDDICSNKNSMAIVNGIIKLASEINMEVIVEGVETEEQLELLAKLKCNYLQGYYLSKPLNIYDLESKIFNFK
jgi:diguanylate cyclase (GGDEF)-like protein/PAS domain S-box-containing protein